MNMSKGYALGLICCGIIGIINYLYFNSAIGFFMGMILAGIVILFDNYK